MGKDPFNGMTVDEFRRLTNNPLVILGRALAPAVNAKLDNHVIAKSKSKPKPTDYCPGCGELADAAPNLCADCLAVGDGES